MKKTKLIDYYEAKLKSEPQHEKYTPMNFAAFLLEIRDFVMEKLNEPYVVRLKVGNIIVKQSNILRILWKRA